MVSKKVPTLYDVNKELRATIFDQTKEINDLEDEIDNLEYFQDMTIVVAILGWAGFVFMLIWALFYR